MVAWPRMRSMGTAWRAGLLAVLAACRGGLGGSEIDGTMSAELAEYDASWTVTPNRCLSGEHQGFFGVDLLEGDREDALLRVLLDPVEGYSLGFNIPGEELALFLDADSGCELFDLEVARQSSRVNEYWNVEGHVLVDCVGPGIDLHIDVVFAGCH